MALNTVENRQILINFFPKLAGDSVYYINSKTTPAYNCIAWAMGFDDRWVDPSLPDSDLAVKKWWPGGIARNAHPNTLIEAFRKLGFTECEDDCTEEGFDKVALYKIQKNNFFTRTVIEEWTHAAKVITPEKYHSKMGRLFDTYHRSGDVFEETSYGTVYQFMKRRIEDREITERIKREEADYQIPDNILEIIMSELD